MKVNIEDISIDRLNELTFLQLRSIAKDLSIVVPQGTVKSKLIELISSKAPELPQNLELSIDKKTSTQKSKQPKQKKPAANEQQSKNTVTKNNQSSPKATDEASQSAGSMTGDENVSQDNASDNSKNAAYLARLNQIKERMGILDETNIFMGEENSPVEAQSSADDSNSANDNSDKKPKSPTKSKAKTSTGTEVKNPSTAKKKKTALQQDAVTSTQQPEEKPNSAQTTVEPVEQSNVLPNVSKKDDSNVVESNATLVEQNSDELVKSKQDNAVLTQDYTPKSENNEQSADDSDASKVNTAAKKNDKKLAKKPINQNKNIQKKAYDPDMDDPSPEDLIGCEERQGILEILSEGFGFLRAINYRQSGKDTYIPSVKIKKFGLRAGDFVVALCKNMGDHRSPAVMDVVSINGIPKPIDMNRLNFENCTPLYPDEKFNLEVEGKKNELAMRAIDIIAPIGKGQRALVVSPPKAGKTTLLKMIANAIAENNPECKIMVLLIDERPEEVTDMKRNLKGDIEVIYSTFDEESENHIKVADLVLSRAKRLVELGKDVVILLDSLTRMARANNVVVPSSGKTLSGGVDPVALYFPKRFFGAARKVEEGGSLTIIATALVDTGSRMDDIVYEEFKGTGNMEIHLDRRLSEKRIFPAIDLVKSGTRKEELLLTQRELEGVYAMRRMLSSGDSQEAAEAVITLMTRTQNNDDFVKMMIEKYSKIKKDGWRVN